MELCPGTGDPAGGWTIDRTVPPAVPRVILRRRTEAAWEFVNGGPGGNPDPLRPESGGPHGSGGAIRSQSRDPAQPTLAPGRLRKLENAAVGGSAGFHGTTWWAPPDNAFRRVVEKQAPVRETLLDYNRVMNEEIRAKRLELGLDTEGGSRP